MRAIILYVFIIASVVAVGIESSNQTADVQMQERNTVQMPIALVSAFYETSMAMSHAEEASYYTQSEEAAPVIEPSDEGEASERKLGLKSVNGITLYDNPEAVVAKLGDPVSKSVDEVWGDLMIYQYPDMEIAFAGEFIQYVNIEASKQLTVDGETLSISKKSLTEAFGKPDFIAEDGIVFQQDDAVLKLFLDEETDEPLYVSYYHIATV